jgi:serine/threonine-protein kinase HipA
MRLTLQTRFDNAWHHAATLELKDDAAGFQGASIIDYDLDYFVAVASAEFSAGKTVRDHRALSVRYPVDLENRSSRS